MKIIDAHAHVGIFADGLNNTCDKFEAYHLERIRSILFKNDGILIEKFLVSNLNCIDNVSPQMYGKLREKGLEKIFLNELDGNREMLAIADKHSILKPLVVCQPDRTENADNIRKILKEGKFYGLKFHPMHMKLEASNPRYDDYLKVAQENQLPCLFHCDAAGCQYSSPEEIYTLAKRHPKVPLILAHLGGGEPTHSRAVNVLLEAIEKDDAALYADISWVDCNSPDRPHIIDVIRKLQNTPKGDMTSRLLFGTDAPIGKFGADSMYEPNYYGETILQIKSAIKEAFKEHSSSIIKNLFYNNTENLFFKKKLNK